MSRSYVDELDLAYQSFAKLKTGYQKTVFESAHLLVVEDEDPKVRISITVGTHGNEVAGLAALNRFLAQLLSTDTPRNISLTLGLGNIAAGRLQKRFVQKDLDRCFGNHSNSAGEEKIAREYEKWLVHCDYNLDFHQTVEPSETAFFVGPDSVQLQSLASQLKSDIPFVAFPIGGFSSDGSPLDDFLLSKGVSGLTIELGQKGFDEAQIEFGAALMNIYLNKCIERFKQEKSSGNRVFRKKAVISNSTNRDSVLRPGINNFTQINSGEVIGRSAAGPIIAPVSGVAMFPKYGDMAKVSAEICYIMVE